MSRNTSDLLDRLDSLDEDELRYLRDRALLPKNHPAYDEEGDNLSVAGNLEDVPNTGDANTAGMTVDDLERLLTKMRSEQETSESDSGDEVEIEDYDEGWSNEDRRFELRKRGLDDNGNKSELIARLLKSDQSESSE